MERQDKSTAEKKKPPTEEVTYQYLGGGEGHGNPLSVSPMKPVTEEAYGGGIYGHDDGGTVQQTRPPASETQSADGPAEEASLQPKHKPPPSSGDRDIDITGQSYIQ